MKRLIVVCFASLAISFSADAQDNDFSTFGLDVLRNPRNLSVSVHGKYNRSVYKEKLAKAKKLSDFVDGYPSNWIDEYVSVEIQTNSKGQEFKSVGKNENLNEAQKNILQSAELFADIAMVVKYYSYPSTNGVMKKDKNAKVQTLNLKLTLIPEVEAEIAGGEKALTSYMQEKLIVKIPGNVLNQNEQARASFIVNESGSIENIKISKTTGDQKTDDLIIEAIQNMPKWKPAKDAKGRKIKQEFRFRVGTDGC
ncbi:MAG: energy transducer TonB family protein [Saprospiraceae bacterium]